ncbi:MAG: hypothetical protein ABI175_22395 [Polyangiales bacterium]
MLATAYATGARADDYALDETGTHPFKVRFDPASRVWIGSSVALRAGPERAVASTSRLDFGLAYRGAPRTSTGATWQLDHRFVSGFVQPAGVPGQKYVALDVTPYSIDVLRHDDSPHVVLPLSPPVSIPFPFDVGFQAQLARVVVGSSTVFAHDGRGLGFARLGVVRAAIVLDPWRSGLPGRSFELGFALRYDVDAYGFGSGPVTTYVHRFAPLTATSVRFRFQSLDGLTTLSVRAEAAPHWTSERRWALEGVADARVERTVLAIEDQPITVGVETTYRYAPATTFTFAEHEIRAVAGVSFALDLR